MEFCNNCNNMYYMKLNNMKQLIYVCKNCGNEDTQQIEKNNLKVYKFSKETKSIDVHINEFTKYDPTLPHVYHIKCPNPECPTSKNSDKYTNDVVYVRYDDRDMKYTYLCYHCDFHWNA